MSDRERWIVYPLLFLAIGLSMRNGVQIDEDHEAHQHSDTSVIRCKGVEVLGADGKPRWILGTTPAGQGSLELTTDQGKLAAQLTADTDGALLSLFNGTGNIALRIGHESRHAVLLLSNRQNTRVQPLIAIPDMPAAEQEQKDEPGTTVPPAKPEANNSQTEENKR